MKKNNKSNMMDNSIYNDMLKHRKKELRRRLKNDDEVLPEGAIPIPPANWNAPPENIQLLSSSPYNQYGYYNMARMNSVQPYFSSSPYYNQMNIDTLYNKQHDDDDYNFDGTEIFDSIGSKKTTPFNSVTSSPLLTPVDEDESKLIPIINNNNNPSLEGNLTGNPFNKELINRIKNTTSKNKIRIKNKRKSTKKSKKSSKKLPSPLKLPDYNGGYKNKNKRTSKKSFKKYNRKKSSKKHVKK